MATHASLTKADLEDIQAGPVVPVPTRNKGFLFFGIKDAVAFRKRFGASILPNITTSQKARGIRETVYQFKAAGQMAPVASITVAFSQQGLTKLSLVDDLQDPAFKQGQLARAESLGDEKKNWLHDFTRTSIHGLFEVTGHPEERVKEYIRDKVKGPLGDSIDVIFEHYAKVRPGKEKDHEHFGFNDGISQPYIQFEDDGSKKRGPLPGQNVVNPGVIILGQTGDELKSQRPSWAFNGSFLVYRHLQQLVPEFDDFLRKTVLASIVNPLPHTQTDNGDFQKRVDFLGARLMGRWKSGCPVVLTLKPSGEFPVDIPEIGRDPQRNNYFDYGPRDNTPRQQFLCPFAAHTRKTGPRTDIDQDSVEKFSISRAGITFGPELKDAEKKFPFKTSEERGLSFVSYQSVLANGFEFIQKSWANNVNFPFNTGPGVQPGFDPIVGQKQGQTREMIGYDVDDLSKELKIPKEFVVAQGGEYFFLPSMKTLREIGQRLPTHSTSSLGVNQWFQPTVRNRLSVAIVLVKFTILYGKYYDIDNQFQETQSAQGTKIQGGNQYEWGHSGRESSPSGTEGSFEVHLDGSDEKIAEIYWDCPYIGSNKLEKRYVKPGYDISFNGFSIPSGALGKGTINVRVD